MFFMKAKKVKLGRASSHQKTWTFGLYINLIVGTKVSLELKQKPAKPSFLLLLIWAMIAQRDPPQIFLKSFKDFVREKISA